MIPETDSNIFILKHYFTAWNNWYPIVPGGFIIMYYYKIIKGFLCGKIQE